MNENKLNIPSPTHNSKLTTIYGKIFEGRELVKIRCESLKFFQNFFATQNLKNFKPCGNFSVINIC